jgi:predicted amidohydrolase YtcJ
MRPSHRLAVTVFSVLALLFAAHLREAVAQQTALINQADMVLYNGKIATVDADFRIVQAVAIRDGKFIAVGTDRDIRDLAGQTTTSIDLQGRTVLPGLIDSHAHLEDAGAAEDTVALGEARTVADALRLIKEKTAKTKAGEWIRGGAWRPVSQLAEHRYLTRTEIDSVAPDNPVYLPTGHFVMANGAALGLAGVTKDTPNPTGGEIEKDKTTGEPTGILAESATHLVADIVPPWTFEQRTSQLKKSMAIFNSYGLTSVVSGAVKPRDLSIYQSIHGRDEQTMRVSVMFTPTGETVPSVSLEDWEKFFKEVGVSSGFGDDWLSYAAIKLGVDGGMTLRTASTRDPYPDDPSYRGFQTIAPGRLNALVTIANRYNWRVGIHCVGDAAIDTVLDAYEAADKEKSILGRRFILIHASLIRPDQMERAKKLGVRADVQNAFMWNKADTVARFLGQATAQRAIPTRTLIDIMGIENVGGGTDYSANILNPFINMSVMITRKDISGYVYGKDQAITRQEAIRLYTSSSARYTFSENRTGSIETGKLADLVVLSADILTVPDDAIKDIQAVRTIVGGRTVFLR